MNIFLDYFDNQISQLLSSIEKHSKQRDGHIKGTLAELTIKSIHKTLFPSHIGTTRGWIIDNFGNRTEERDVIVYDKNSAPVFMLDESTGLIPADAVVNDIQVKSSIRIKDIEKLLNNVIKFYKIPQYTLFSFKAELGKYNPLEAFLLKDESFLISPKIQNIVIGSHGFYVFEIQNIPLRNYFSHDDLIKKLKELYPFLKNEELRKLQTIDKIDIVNEFISKFNNPKSITINNINFTELIDKDIQIVSWHGLHLNKMFNDTFRYYFAISMNKLFENNIGRYLLNEELKMKTFSRKIFFEGKEIFSKIDLKDGINKTIGRFGFEIGDGEFSLTCSEEEQEA